MGTRRSGIINIKNEIIFARISNKIDDKVYIGSTIKPLVKRLGDHIYSYKKDENMKLYDHFRLHGLHNFEIELLDHKIVKNMNEMKMIEQLWIDKENPENLLNSKRSYKDSVFKNNIIK